MLVAALAIFPVTNSAAVPVAALLRAAVLSFVRVSGLFAFAPIVGSSAVPVRGKAVFAMLLAWLITPIAMVHSVGAVLGPQEIFGELAVGMVFGLTLTLMSEMLTFAGQVAGLQFSFSLVNVLDPNSRIETPVMGQLFGLLGTLTLIAAGLDRVMIAAFLRTYNVVPPGMAVLSARTGASLVAMAGGIFLAGVELVTPILAATLLVEFSISLMGKLSPQLPVMSLTVPLKTLVGMATLIGSLALWPRFIEARFSALLDAAGMLVAQMAPAVGGR
jgi:flagellar biosynthetic protein FliR